jgi:putative transposase
MKRGRTAVEINFMYDEKEKIEKLANSNSLPHHLVQRAKIVLKASQGKSNQEIAQEIGMDRSLVSKWRNRFAKFGMEGLYDLPRSGRPRTISDDQVAGIILKTLEEKPKDATHWSCRSMREETGTSRSSINRIWRAFGLKPHLSETFKLSNDPFFVEKVIDIVGLYLNPPDNAIVLGVDEKSQCQALERTQPLLPLAMGYSETTTHDYIRHGTTTLFAAFNVATGKVLSQCKKKHRHQEFIEFLNHIEKNVPPDLDIHLVIDNYSTHKHQKVKGWFARHPRYHVHFTPTYSSWLNQVERWFGIITQKAIRRSTSWSASCRWSCAARWSCGLKISVSEPARVNWSRRWVKFIRWISCCR